MEKNQIVALVFNLLLLIFTINSIKKNKLQEKYALLWIFSSFTFILFSIWFNPIIYLSQIFGIIDPSNLLFMMGGLYLILINLHFSFTLSKTSSNYKTIVQRIALLEHKINSLKKEFKKK